jgi:hypothetical protein
MNKILLNSILFLIIFGATIQIANAQNFSIYYDDLIQRFNSYSDSEILPVYIKLKDEFEKKLLPADKASLDSLREEVKTTKMMIGSEHQIYMEMRESDIKVSRGEIRNYVTEVRKHLNKLNTESQAFVQKYNAQLKESLKSLEKHQPRWAKGMDSVVAAWEKANKVELDDIRIKYGTIRMDSYMQRVNTLKVNIEKNVGMSDFLLWDGRFDLIMADIFDEEETADKVEMVVSPNPFTNNCKIKFNIPLTEEVDVRVIDAQAQLIAQLYKGNWEAGEHELDFDITKVRNSPVQTGAYYLKISSKSYVVTKMIISKK